MHKNGMKNHIRTTKYTKVNNELKKISKRFDNYLFFPVVIFDFVIYNKIHQKQEIKKNTQDVCAHGE